MIEIALLKARIEEQLKKSEQWLAAIIKNIGDGLIVLDQDGNIKTFNLTAEQLFDMPVSDVLGKNFRLLLPKKDLEHQIIERAQEARKFEAELQMQRKDGTIFPARIHVSTIQQATESPSTYIVIVRDLSEKKEVENLRITLAHTTEYLEKIRKLLDEEIGVVVTYAGPAGPTIMFNHSCLSEKELFNASYRGFTLLMSGINYKDLKLTKFAGIIEIPDSSFFALGFYRAVKGHAKEIQADPRLESTAVMCLLVMRKKVMAFILQEFLQIEEFLADEMRSWNHLTDLSETKLEMLHKRIRDFILKVTEKQREELLEPLAEFLDMSGTVQAPESALPEEVILESNEDDRNSM